MKAYDRRASRSAIPSTPAPDAAARRRPRNLPPPQTPRQPSLPSPDSLPGAAGTEARPAPRRAPDEDACAWRRRWYSPVPNQSRRETWRACSRTTGHRCRAGRAAGALCRPWGWNSWMSAPASMFRTALDLAPRLRKVIEAPRRLPASDGDAGDHRLSPADDAGGDRAHPRHGLSQQTLDSLLELNLIAPAGRREAPGGRRCGAPLRSS